VNEPDTAPPEIVHVGAGEAATGAATVTAHEVSVVRNPVPVKETKLAAWPDVGVKMIVAVFVVMVKGAVPVSLATFPVAVTVFNPVAWFAMTKEPVRVPPEIEHVKEVEVIPVNVQAVSVWAKLEPVTCTVLPMIPVFGLRLIVGPTTFRTVVGASPPGLAVPVTT